MSSVQAMDLLLADKDFLVDVTLNKRSPLAAISSRLAHPDPISIHPSIVQAPCDPNDGIGMVQRTEERRIFFA